MSIRTMKFETTQEADGVSFAAHFERGNGAPTLGYGGRAANEREGIIRALDFFRSLLLGQVKDQNNEPKHIEL